ncbi:CsgE family curli-type amyloid fiber assembly protein [Algicola sagamiensis]|uniref:CsgE family curli-type amyloid fiber assembly protein n=1 Tax=Algicola sagamiensis TaxID=163869 RepID=UPI0003602AE0|nr:CsgE family curli-type amyloid fiber assembly protein [Algicola sagamiensis]
MRSGFSTRKYIAIFLSIQFFILPAHAVDDITLSGFIIDQSISRFGHEFAKKLGLLWQEVPGTAGFNLAVKERVTPKSGTKVWLELNHKVIYVTYFGRRATPIEERVDQALQSVMDAMIRSSLEQDTEDIAISGW